MLRYSEFLNIDDFWEKKTSFDVNRWNVSFYCKDCEKIVEAIREKKESYIFRCPICNWNNISIWTLAWLKENYKIK